MHWWQMRDDGALSDLMCNQALHHVIQHRSAQISTEQTQILFSLLNEKGFFDLAPIYSPGGMLTYEGDVLVMAARYIGRSHRVLARPPDYYPDPLQRIVTRYLTLEVSWGELEPAEWYWRAEIVTPQRAARIRSRGLLAFFTTNESELSRLPFLAQAILEPGGFVPATGGEAQEILNRFDGVETFMLTFVSSQWVVDLWKGGQSVA